MPSRVALRVRTSPPRAFFGLALVALVAVVALGLACAGTEKGRFAPIPHVDQTVPSERLPIDGIWQREDKPNKQVQIDRGRIYRVASARDKHGHGDLLYRHVHQASPNTYRAEQAQRTEMGIVWHPCTLVLEHGVLETRGAVSAKRLVPIALADPIWLEAQSAAWYIVAAREAHRQPPEVVVVAIAPLPDLPPSAPPEKRVLLPKAVSPYGDFHALVVGAGDYLYLPAVATAEGDADAISALLREQYKFAVTDLRNPTRAEFWQALEHQADTLGEGDNLLVYFAGQSFLDEERGRCFWLPVDAFDEEPSASISNDDLAATFRRMRARRILVVADGCFTASQLREAELDESTPDRAGDSSPEHTRVVLTSGGNEPLQDGAGGPHSVFTGAVLAALRAHTGRLDGARLFTETDARIEPGSSQRPEYANIRGADHEGGDFVFVPTKP